MTPLLEVEDLHVWFDLEDSAGAPRGAGRQHVARGGRAARPRRRVGLRQDDDRAGGARPAPADVERLRAGCSWRARTSWPTARTASCPHRWVDIAIVFQGAMNALNPVRTIGSQIVEALELHGRATGPAARARTADLLESVGIPASRAERFPHELSGGMRQRAAIAMALSCNPKVLIADEPTTALDVMVQAQILELLDGLCRDFGLALDPRHARPARRGAALHARRGHVRGRDRRERPRGRPVPRAAASVHAAPVRRDARPRRRTTAASRRFRALRRGSTGRSTGCPFRPRCDSSFEPCATERPLLQRRRSRALGGLPPQRPGAGAGMSALLEVEDLVVRYPVAARALRIARAARGTGGARGRRRHALAGRRRAGRARRRVGLRQDDDCAGRAQARRSRVRRDSLRGPRHRPARPARAPPAPARDPDRLPGPVRVARPAPSSARCDRRAAPHPPDRRLEGGAPRSGARGAGARRARRRRSSSSTAIRTSCPAGSASGLRSPPRSSSNRACSSPTSRSRCSTSRSGPAC